MVSRSRPINNPHPTAKASLSELGRYGHWATETENVSGGIYLPCLKRPSPARNLAFYSGTSSHKWEIYRGRRFGRFSRRRATSILRSVRKERGTQKIGQSAIGLPGWLEKGPSASLLVRHVSQRIRSSLAPSIQTLLKPTVYLPLMR
jgi:hypothetical protein